MRQVLLPLARQAKQTPAIARPGGWIPRAAPGSAVSHANSAPAGPSRVRPLTNNSRYMRTDPAQAPVSAIPPFPARADGYKEGEQA